MVKVKYVAKATSSFHGLFYFFIYGTKTLNFDLDLKQDILSFSLFNFRVIKKAETGK